ncbi:MAG: 16S rRNA (guanine(966)-N(2))-methyltransferase RsmD [Ruminococcaceae bacterium]|nr:16S rRNA (guanine(966)-N(2))-methyltransferase RsmD [Oscillospiraceae bacterium]
MRVISGLARGRKLRSLEGDHTRPTTDRVKESVFNIVMPYVRSAKALDLFAGSGALGIEALSRGAESCTFVENSRAAVEVIQKNLEDTRLGVKATVRMQDALVFLENTEPGYDLIFLDPPYDGGFYQPVLDAVARRGLLAEEGVLVLEKRAEAVLELPEAVTILKERKYGKTAIVVLAIRKEETI